MLFVITGDIKTIKEIYDTFRYVSQFTHFLKRRVTEKFSILRQCSSSD